VRRFCTYLKLLVVVVVVVLLLLLLSVIQQPFANPSITDPFIPSPVEIPPDFNPNPKICIATRIGRKDFAFIATRI
jgi:hypothetical protein